ncbi:MAG: MOSC domain-containing protein [Roseiflexaceae bacterium]|nr:MOSC domain-containing protein [Roseiflexaceae bacterium]
MTHVLPAQLVSVHVGLPRRVEWKGYSVLTGIWKEPVDGPVVAHHLNLDGDRQADLTVHGGAAKAIYAYPVEHYDLWRRELVPMEVAWGMFGENLTTQGLSEESVLIGERFQIGEAVCAVTQPRQPCYKLAVRFGRDDILRRFVQSRRTGWYFSVEREGAVAAGDPIIRLDAPAGSLSVAAVADLLFARQPDSEQLRVAATLPALPWGLRLYFEERLAALHEQ